MLCAFFAKAETASSGVAFPWATCANICGMRNVLYSSSMTGVELPGCPGFVVYFSAIVVRMVYLPFGLCGSCAESLRIVLKPPLIAPLPGGEVLLGLRREGARE